MFRSGKIAQARRIAASALLCVLTVYAASGSRPSKHRRPKRLTVTATAFAVEGTNAAGTQSQVGTCAADPAVLPLGSRIRVTGAGKYSGVYTVADTGQKVVGREIDIFIPDPAEAKEFGKKRVRVHVLHYGDWP
jgi:3D (Asp-Asp-Asp) domain-containing protein